MQRLSIMPPLLVKQKVQAEAKARLQVAPVAGPGGDLIDSMLLNNPVHHMLVRLIN